MRTPAITTRAALYQAAESVGKVVVRKHVGAKPAPPRNVVICTTTSSTATFGAHNNNAINLVRAINERVHNVVDKPSGSLKPTPQPVDGWWRRLDAVAGRLAKRVAPVGKVPPMTVDQFIAQCPANKRELYARAAVQYRRYGVKEKDAWIKAFVKFEKLNFTDKPDPCPRVIQPRSPVYNIALGRHTRRVESELYSALAREWRDDEEAVVMKGLTVTETADLLRKKWNRVTGKKVCIGLDASRFDQHVSVDALTWEHGIYNRIFQSAELRRLLKFQLDNKGFAYIDGVKVEYASSGTRASGDMNTSLGNCLIMCTLVREYVREKGVKVEFANNGDDCVLFMSDYDYQKCNCFADLPSWFLKYGFEMDVEDPVYEFEQVVFCQAQPVLVDAVRDEWVMVRQPTAAMGKDAMSLSVATEVGFRQWSYQVGVGGFALYGDMPIYSELYKLYQREGVKSNVKNSYIVSDSGFMRMAKIPRVRDNDSCIISDDTRVSYYKAFGYIPSMQIKMEAELRNMSYGGIARHSVNTAARDGLTTMPKPAPPTG